jgi:hypothetical protein
MRLLLQASRTDAELEPRSQTADSSEADGSRAATRVATRTVRATRRLMVTGGRRWAVTGWDGNAFPRVSE